MIFTLLPDYTYSISPAPERTEEVRLDTPNRHTLDILQLMRNEPKPWCVKDLVDHENVGGAHRKRAIVYSLNKLEDQKLIEEVDVPKLKVKVVDLPSFIRQLGGNYPDLLLPSRVIYPIMVCINLIT